MERISEEPLFNRVPFFNGMIVLTPLTDEYYEILLYENKWLHMEVIK